MTKKEAIEIIENNSYVFNPLNFDKTTMINTALDMAVEALKRESGQPKTGHFIFNKTIFDKHGYTAECSSCHKKWKTYDEIRFKKEHNFCPICGARIDGIIVIKESEEEK